VTIRPNLTTRWLWQVRRAPIVLDLALSCRGDLAVANVAGPGFASIAIDSVVQRADVCITPTPVPTYNPFGIRIPSVPVGILLVLAGVCVGGGCR
jgi:hypothetical protein